MYSDAVMHEDTSGPSYIAQPVVAAFGPDGPNHKEEEVDQLASDDDLPSTDDEEVDPTHFRIHKPLPKFKEYTRQLGEVHKMIHDGVIELNPDYQRDVVWPAAKQTQLIESIFRNYTVPQVVLSVTTDDNGEELRNCVDGKQRLTSIQRFIDGLIPYKDPKTKTRFWYTTSDTHKGKRHLIPPKYKEYFITRTITISEYSALSDLQEREVFQRVQLGVSLKNTEKLRAIASPRGRWLAQLEERHVSLEDGLSSKINFDTTHARDFANLLALVFLCHALPDQIDPTNSKLEKWLSGQEELDKDFKLRIDAVLRSMWVIASTEHLNAAFKKMQYKVAPLEFVFIGVFLYILRDEESREKQAKAIHRLRIEIRKRFGTEVKMNNSAQSKEVWSFIRNIQRELYIGKSPKRRHHDDDESDTDIRPSHPVKKSKARPKRT